MKKNCSLKMIISIMTVMALMSTTAFAAVGQPGVAVGNDGTPAVESSENGESTGKNMLVHGKVTEISKQKDFTTIAITNDQMGMVFHVSEPVFVIDQKTKNFMQLVDIKKDSQVAVVIDKMAPMTMSLPPQTNGAIGFILNTEDGSIDLSVYNDDFLNWEKSLQIHLDENTKIIDSKNSKRLYKPEDVKFAESLVFYNIATLSLPAQTNPDMVLILNSADELTSDKAKEEVGVVTEKLPIEYASLREGAEAKGYKINWTSNKAPITLTKDDAKVVITIGSDKFTFSHNTKDIKPLDRMEKLDGPVKLEKGKTMVPKTFIEAL